MWPANRQVIRQPLPDTLLCSLVPGVFRGNRNKPNPESRRCDDFRQQRLPALIQSLLFSVYKLIFSLISIQLTRILIFANKLELFVNIML